MDTNDMTITDVEFYEEFHEELELLRDKMELYRMVDEGLADIEAGRYRPADEVLSELREKMDKRRGVCR
jgi:hypothetical protein